MKKILIPTLRFPPAGGVGLRRILKMGKNMAKDGIEVHYLTTHNSVHINSYNDDIKGKNIVVQKIASLSLNNFLNKKRYNLIDKIITKIVYYMTLPLFFIDYATLWGLVLIPYSYFYIKKNHIKNIYASGAPFSTLIHMAILKMILKEKVNLICEWRDVWTDDYERIYLPPRRVSRWIQIKLEKFVIGEADYVVGVTNSITRKLMGYGFEKEKFFVIENGYDKDSFQSLEDEMSINVEEVESNKERQKKVICYAGSIVDTRSEGFFLFLDAIVKYPEGDIVIEMCGELGYAVKKKIERKYAALVAKGMLIHHGVVSTADAISLIRRSDFCLVIVQRQQPEAIASKFFEYCAAQKPIIAIGPCGDLQSKMEENRVGRYFELDKFSDDYGELYSYLQGKFDKKAYSFGKILLENDFCYLSRKMEKLLK